MCMSTSKSMYLEKSKQLIIWDEGSYSLRPKMYVVLEFLEQIIVV